jgi:hypothetical protein
MTGRARIKRYGHLKPAVDLAAAALGSPQSGRAARFTGLLGIAASVLLLLSYVLVAAIPAGNATDEEIAAFYVDANRRLVVIAGLYVAPFAAIAFLWFIVVLRTWINMASPTVTDTLISNIQLVSGIVFIGLVLCASAAISTPAAAYEFAGAPVNPEVARQLPAFGNTLLFFISLRMAAMFVIATSTIVRQVRALPRWLWLLGYALGAALLVAVGFAPLFVFALPAWMLVLSIVLLSISRRAM